jgi:hypothetical protein
MNATQNYSAAWQDRRRRMLAFKTIQFGFLGLFIFVAFLSSRVKLPNQVLLVFPIWFMAYIIAGVWLNRFRCPRCGHLYYLRMRWHGYMERQNKWRDCRHCGLPQDAEPS